MWFCLKPHVYTSHLYMIKAGFQWVISPRSASCSRSVLLYPWRDPTTTLRCRWGPSALFVSWELAVVLFAVLCFTVCWSMEAEFPCASQVFTSQPHRCSSTLSRSLSALSYGGLHITVAKTLGWSHICCFWRFHEWVYYPYSLLPSECVNQDCSPAMLSHVHWRRERLWSVGLWGRWDERERGCCEVILPSAPIQPCLSPGQSCSKQSPRWILLCAATLCSIS